MTQPIKPTIYLNGKLQIESLEYVLSSVTFDINNLVPWPWMKYPAEYQKLLTLLWKLQVKVR